MTNHRQRVHIAERAADLEQPRQRAGFRPCGIRGCAEQATGVLCDPHWVRLPWSMRNDVGAAHRPPATAPVRWLREANEVLSPRASYRATKALSREEQRFRPEALRILSEHQPPATRAECRGGPRPCPWVRCSDHLAIGVTEAGTLQLNFPGKELDELEETCARDVAERGAVSASRAGELVGLKRGRVGQMQKKFRSMLRARGVTP